MTAIDDPCGNTKAPPGWWCSRGRGHPGPCAAEALAHVSVGVVGTFAYYDFGLTEWIHQNAPAASSPEMLKPKIGLRWVSAGGPSTRWARLVWAVRIAWRLLRR